METCKNTDIHNVSLKYTLEHIYCQRDKAKLKDQSLMDNIGNLTLIEGKNSENGHKGNSSEILLHKAYNQHQGAHPKKTLLVSLTPFEVFLHCSHYGCGRCCAKAAVFALCFAIFPHKQLAKLRLQRHTRSTPSRDTSRFQAGTVAVVSCQFGSGVCLGALQTAHMHCWRFSAKRHPPYSWTLLCR